MIQGKNYQKWALGGMVLLCLLLAAAALHIPRHLVFGPGPLALRFLAIFILLSVGVCYSLAKRKGHHPGLAFLGLLTLPGCWLLLILRNKNTNEDPDSLRRLKRFQYAALGVSFPLALIVAFIDYNGINMVRTECDRQARLELSNVGKALERLENELLDKGLGPDKEKFRKEFRLDYLLGTYYGWKGVDDKYGVRLRIAGDEVWGCSMCGRRTGNENHSIIYRVSLFGAKELPAIGGVCEGAPYGGVGRRRYQSTMIKDGPSIGGPDK